MTTSTTPAPAVNASRISQYLGENGWSRFNGNSGKGGYRVSKWLDEGPVVRVEYHGARKDLGIGRFSESTVAKRMTSTLREIRASLESGGYNVSWGWDKETQEPDTSFLAVTPEPRSGQRLANQDKDPYSNARQLMGWVENYLIQAKYLKSGSDPAAPYFGFDVQGSIDGWGETHVTVQYRPGQFEEYSAIMHTVQAYAKVLSDHGLATIVRTTTGNPVLYVANDAADLLKVVARQDEYEETSRRHAEESEAEHEYEENEAMDQVAGRRLRALLISLPQVEAAVREIQDLVGDGKEEEARRLETQTYRNVLLAVVGGAEAAQDLAAAALETQHLAFRR